MGRRMDRTEDNREDQYFFHLITLELGMLYLFSYLPTVITLAKDMICIDAVITHEHILLENESYIESSGVELKGKWLKKFTLGLKDYMSSYSLK